MYKECNVLMLPTQLKAVRKDQLVIGVGNYLFGSRQSNNIGSLTAYELYITSDEETKEGDWCIDIWNNEVIQMDSATKNMLEAGMLYNPHAKIIATTDSNVMYYSNNERDGYNLPQIPKSFIQQFITEYNKGNVITKVMVEYVNVPNSVFIQEINAPYVTLKINPENTIKINLIKDNWNNDEIQELFSLFFSSHYKELSNIGFTSQSIREWVKERL